MTIDLSTFNISRPEKIRWWFPDCTVEGIFEHIVSNKLRKTLSHHESIIKEKKISYHLATLSKSGIEDWITFYQAKMIQQGYQIFATRERLLTLLEDNEQLFTMDYFINQQLVGRKLITIHDRVANSRFKASDHISDVARGCSFGSLMDFLYVYEILSQKLADHIAFGKSRNMFGTVNKPSYLLYKLSFGQIAKRVEDEQLSSTVEVNDHNFVFFLGVQNSQPRFYSIRPEIETDFYTQIKNRLSGNLTELDVA